MEERLVRLENDMVELKLKYEKLLEQLEQLKQEDTTGGIILDGCNDDVKNYIEGIKKEGE